MRSATPIRGAAVAAALLLLAGVAGCAGRFAPGRARDDGPEVRIHGARILAPDPEHAVEPPPLPPFYGEEDPEGRLEADLGPAGPPAGVGEGVIITLDLVDTRAVDALRSLAYQGEVDMVVAGGGDVRVTIHLKDAPWLEAFEAVLDGAHLVAQWEGRRVRVLTAEQMAAERAVDENLERITPSAAVIRLQNMLAKDAASALAPVLSATARVGVDEETNTLLVSDTPRRLSLLRRAAERLDRLPPQVMIEAIIVDVALEDDLAYGFDWTAIKQGGDTMTLGQALSTAAGTNPATNPGGFVTFVLGGSDFTITGLLDFLQSHDNTQVLANPKVLAINNRTASIEIIDEVPFQQLTQTSGGGQIGTTEFKEVGVKLLVTPRIAADGSVHMELNAEQSNQTGAVGAQGVPVINTRRSSTTLTVRDGQTFVLGGLRRVRTAVTEDKVPFFGDIPGLGALFRRNVSVEVETELVIFIRPRIVRPGATLTRREATLAGAIDHPDRRPQILRSAPLRCDVEGQDEDRRTVP